MKPRRLLVLFLASYLSHLSPISAQDSVKNAVTLPEVSITTFNERPDELFTQTPTQVLSTNEVQRLAGPQVSDAIKLMSGTTLKDYGGIGGVKTVSVRGLGSQFSTLAIDGIAVNDCQNGQVDLGRYLLGNSQFISLSNGQSDNALQSARSYASGSIISLQTHEPEGTEATVGAEAGSFGYLSPTLGFGRRLSRRSAISFWSNYTRCEGDYPYTLYYTASHNDSSSHQVRHNSQMQMGTADLNYFCRFDSHRRLHVKAHYMQDYHALPGPVIFYSAKESEHSEARLFFTQARYTHQAARWEWQLLAKYHSSGDLYEDTAARTPSGVLRNEYRQQEGYLSQAFLFHDGQYDGPRTFTLSLSADEALTQLHSNLSAHNEVQRTSLLGVLAAQYRPHLLRYPARICLNANLLGTYVSDREAAAASTPYARLTPYLGVTLSPNRASSLTFRYFYKETYRVPNFNELYYFTVGRALQPEKARQHNLGISYHSRTILLRDSLSAYNSATLDLYCNRVSDKIIATPTNNMFLWSMANLGIVDIWGLDLTGEGQYYGRLPLTISFGYSYQHAVDHTDPANKTYGHQIPYTPRHSGNISLTAHAKWFNLGYSVLLAGKRYSMGQNSESSLVKGYVDQGITLSREFHLHKGSINAKVQVLNLFDVQYEVIKNYPMMGRNYRFSLSWNIE